MRLSDEESERLEQLAEHYGLTVSGVIRMLAKREVDKVLASSRAKSKPKR